MSECHQHPARENVPVNCRALLTLSLLAGLMLGGIAEAGVKPHCRDFEFSGAAGFSSNDAVTFRIVAPDGEVLTESCVITVQSLESSVAFVKRIPESWGDGSGGTPVADLTCRVACTEGNLGNLNCINDSHCDSEPGNGVCGDRPKKVCGGQFTPRPDTRHGFCCRLCRSKFLRAARVWVLRELSEGRLSIAELRVLL